MALELYFALGVFFFVSLNAIAQVEQYVEERSLAKSKHFDSVVGPFKGIIAKYYRCDDEFYCFFKKDAFDLN
ncbi:hypothetical protein [Maridesulfovibrio sp.]|jgi:hypothetical protein|uniref:hypothetical protein n=1 Tax=Maridesulfovibrio sp. TaxID=2795000 RepID=UPI0029C9C1A3|nr:hypothetical protein [Maridesulfovibrio sp.]